MSTALELSGVAILAMLAENFVLVSGMGIGARVSAFRDPRDAIRSGYCLTIVMVLGALLSWPIDHHILTPFGWQHFRLLVFALLIPAIVALLRYLIRTFVPELSRRMDQNLSSVIYNCAALGSALLISLRSLSFLSGVIFALFGGIGATIALASFASLQNEVDLERCPSCFRGLPIKLITAGLMALSLVGFYGLNFQ